MNLSELARGIKPFVQRWIDGALLGGDRDLGTVGNPYNTLYADTVTAGTIVGTMTGGEWETTGNATIDANQASATTVVYVVNQASGGTANLDVEGSIVVGGTVDGVDVSAHAANANDHHDQSHVLATTSGLGPDHTVSGLTSGQVLRASNATTALFGNLAHAETGGIGANDHHDQAHVLATNLALGGDHTISGATAGHVLRASSATAAAFAAIADADLPSTIVRTSRTLTAGAGLTGGGDLTADRAFAVGAGLGITVNADDVALTTPGSLSASSTNASTGSHTHAIDSTIARSAITITAGAGLTGGGDLTASRTLDVGVSGLGMSVGADAIALASSSNPGAAASILATDASGALTLVRATLSQATGTAPLTVSSTTVVSNLNADKADGYDFDQDVRVAATPQFARLGLGVAAHATYKLSVLGDSLMDGHVEADTLDVNGATTVYGGDLKVFPVGDFTTPLLYVDESIRSIGVNRDPDPQFDVDVAGALRAAWLVGPHAIQLSDATAIMHFDGPGPYETNYTGTSQTHKGDVATITGHIIYRPGKFQKAVQVAEGTTNLFVDPSFEVSSLTTHWTRNVGGGTGDADSVSNALSLYGTRLGRMSKGDVYCYIYQTITTTVAAYTLSVYARRNDGAAMVLSDLDAVIDNSHIAFDYVSEPENGWYRYTKTVTETAAANVTGVWVVTSALVLLDGIQFEQKAYATPYHDGSLTEPESWDGTVNASTSTRTAATLYYPADNMPVASGTIMCWMKRPTNANPGYNRYFEYGEFSSPVSEQWIALLGGNTTSAIIFAAYGTSGGTEKSVAYPTDNEWHHVACTWQTGGLLSVYVDGVLAGTSSMGAYAETTAAQPYLWLAGCPGSDAPKELYDDFVILSRAADSDEIRAIYESDAPVFAESSVAFFKSYGPTPVEINDEGIFVEGPIVGAIFGVYGAASTKSWGGVTLSEGDILIGRSPAYALWDDSEVKLKIGNVSAEYIAFDGSKIEFFNGATSMATLDGTTWTLGQTGANQSNTYITAGAVQLRNNTTVKVDLQSDGDIFLGTDTSAAATTTLAVFSAAQTYNGETMGVGDLLLGDNSSGKANLWWDKSAGTFNFRGGTTTQAYIGTDGKLKAGSFEVNNASVLMGSKFQLTINSMLIGSNLATENVSFATIFENATQIGTTPGDEAFDAGDVLIGDWENANVLWDASAGQLKFRDATTVQAYVDTDGSIKAGAGAVTLDAGGITIASEYAAVSAPSVGGDPTAIVWKDGATEVAWLTVYTDPVLTLQSAGDLYISTQYDMYLSAFDGTVIVDSYMRANGPITFLEQTGAPTNPVDGTQTQTYMKGDKFVIQYNHGGTLKYRYLTLTSTDATWTYTTTAP